MTGDAGKACRIEKCRKPANARRLNLIQRAKNNRCMKCAKQGRGAPECKRRNCLNKAQKADCKACKEGIVCVLCFALCDLCVGECDTHFGCNARA